MAIPLDVTETFGSGCLEAIKRVFLMASCLILGCFVGSLSLTTAGTFTLLFQGSFADAFELYLSGLILSCWAFIWGLFSVYGILMSVLILITVIYFFSFERGNLRGWLFLSSSYATCITLGFASNSGAPYWLVGISYLLHLAILISSAIFIIAWNRNRFAHHLIEVAIETEARRVELQENFDRKREPVKERTPLNKPPQPDAPKA